MYGKEFSSEQQNGRGLMLTLIVMERARNERNSPHDIRNTFACIIKANATKRKYLDSIHHFLLSVAYSETIRSAEIESMGT